MANNELKKVGLVFTQEGAVDFKKSLQEINLEMNKNYNQFKLTQAQWDKSTTSAEKLKAQQEYLTNAYAIQEDKVKTLKMQLSELENSENKNTTAIKKKRNELTSAQIKLEDYKNKLKDVENQLTSNGKKLEEWGDKVQKSGDKIEKASSKLSAFSAATVAALVGASKSAIDFETAFTGVEKTVDATPEQLENIKQGIRDMAKEIPASTTEIAGVAEAAGQLGIKTENILSFSKAMIDLGNSTNLTADEAASQLAKFANIMNMSQSDFDKLGSSIVDLGNHFATTEADIVEMAMRLAGAGKQVGLSEGQVLGLATALSSVGIEAEMGGSAISKAMVKMQNAVDLGGGKMETVLKKAGMSLHEMELLAANSPKDFKALAGSLDMTSTELKNMITAGTNLEDFAKVSGMTVEQFKKAWKEDAAGALSAFIQGLGHAEDKGESAITMLSEMGLTEVRLRDSLLRAANAGELFTDALKTGTTAWEDNTALANEANKRYATLQSKIQIATNKLKDLAITFGNKLMPSIDKGIGKIEAITKKVEGLNDSQVEWILKTAAVVVAIGPLIKILGNVTSVTGKTVKGIGTFIQAIGVMHGSVTTTSTSVNTLASFLTKVISPTGLATAAVIAFTAAMVYHIKKTQEASKLAKEYSDSMADLKSSAEEYNKNIDDGTSSELAHITRVKALKDELSKIVDENGKVKKGYEERVSYILNELNGALGTEYNLNGNVISSYKELQENIDKTISKKKAEVILAASAKKWENAYNNQSEALITQNDALHKLEDTANKYGTSVGGLSQKIEEYRNKIKGLEEDIKSSTSAGERTYFIDQKNQAQAAINEIESYQKAYGDATTVVQQYTNDTKKYEEDLKNYTEGNYEALYNSVTTNTEKYTNKSLEDIKNSLNAAKREYDDYSASVSTTGNKLAEERRQQAEKNIQTLADELRKRTTTVGELSQEEISAWETLAKSSYSVYEAELCKMEPAMAKNIQEATGAMIRETPFAVSQAQSMSQQIVDQLDKNAEFRAQAVSNLQGLLNGMSDENLRNLLVSAGVQDVDKVMQGIRSGNLAEQEGVNILKSLNNGLQSSSFSGTLFATARGIASTISGLLNIKPKVSAFDLAGSILKGHKLGLDYVPKDNYVARLHKGERVLTAEENKEYTKAEEESKKRNSTSVVHTTNVASNEIVERILETNSKMVTLLQRILETNNKSIVLDTGELVGATADKYNIELERIRRKDERGS